MANTTKKKPAPTEKVLKLVTITSPYDEDGTPAYSVVTDDPSEIARLQQRGEQKGYDVRVRTPDSFAAAWRFFDAISNK